MDARLIGVLDTLTHGVDGVLATGVGRTFQRL
jgi:hypothetical protein